MAKAKEKAPTRDQKMDLIIALIKSMPEANVESVETVATAMMTGYNLGRQSVQTA